MSTKTIPLNAVRSQAKPRYRLHTDGTLSLIGGGLDAVCGQLTYVPKGQPCAL